MQSMRCEGDTVVVTRSNKIEERHQFRTRDEALSRMQTVSESLTWDGTPFRDMADIRGPSGGVDCAMLLVRSYVDSGRLPSFDPRPYPTQWHMNQSKELFLGWVEGRNPATGEPWVPEYDLTKTLRGKRIAKPSFGDVIVYQYGRCFSHGAIMINSEEIIHAYSKSKVCHISLMRETDLCFLRSGKPRPRLYFEVASWQ